MSGQRNGWMDKCIGGQMDGFHHVYTLNGAKVQVNSFFLDIFFSKKDTK